MSVDVRTRNDAPGGTSQLPSDAAEFFETTLPDAIAAHGDLVIPGLRFLRPRPATFEIEGGAWTMAFDDDCVTVRPGGDDRAAHVRLEPQQLTDLVHDQATFMGMWAAGTLDQTRGTVGHLLNWWLVLRAVFDDVAIFTPGSISFADRDGAPLDLARHFDADDGADEMRHFLEEAGFLHIRGLFGADEMAAVSDDMDRAVPGYHEGDGRSWWARTADGASRLVRMQGFDRESAATDALIDDSRFLELASIAGAGHQFGTRRAHNRIEALFKPIGVTEGISDIPWHKDCGLGRHSYDCCGMTVGISVTGADDTSGQLRVLAGSHRALIWSGVRQPDLDLPDVALPTETGDVTIHLSCTMHMAQPPVDRERRVMYTGFGLPPRDTADPDALAAARSRLGSVRETAPLTVLGRHFKS